MERPLSFLCACGVALSAHAFSPPNIPIAFERAGQETFVTRPHGVRIAIQPNRVSFGSGVDLEFLGADPRAVISGEDRAIGRTNHLIGRNPAHWRLDVVNYARVRVAHIYRHIDLLYSIRGGELEYDLIVQPGGDIRTIHIRLRGESPRMDDRGDLVVATPSGEFRHHSPIAFQAGVPTRTIDCSQFIDRAGVIGFTIGRYDRARALVIDPAITHSTFFGGSSDDVANAIAVDRSGNVYIAGSTYSADLPIVNAFQQTNRSFPTERDAFVAKLDPTGTQLIFATYFGGSKSYDIAHALAVGSDGSIYVGGETHSLDFPVTPGALQTKANEFAGSDGFIARFGAAGNTLIYSSYFAADSSAPSFESIRSIAVDGAGNAYFTGDATDPSIPTTSGAYRTTGCGGGSDAFVTAINPAGTAMLFSTFICGSGYDLAKGLALDRVGDIYVTGSTTSTDFPTTTSRRLTGASDAYVAKLERKGAHLIYSTLIGASEGELPAGVAVDDSGNAYIGGSTNSNDFPVKGAFQTVYGGGPTTCLERLCGDGFVVKLDTIGAIAWASYLGGSNGDDLRGIAIDSNRRIYVVGQTSSSSFPRVQAIRATLGGSADGYLSVVSGDGTLVFSTFLGGSDVDESDAVAADEAGNAYVAGATYSADFPTVTPLQATKKPGDNRDAYITVISVAFNAPSRRRAVRH